MMPRRFSGVRLSGLRAAARAERLRGECYSPAISFTFAKNAFFRPVLSPQFTGGHW